MGEDINNTDVVDGKFNSLVNQNSLLIVLFKEFA